MVRKRQGESNYEFEKALGYDFKEAGDYDALIVEQTAAELICIPDALGIIGVGCVSACVNLNTVAGGLPEIDGLSACDGVTGGTDVFLKTIDGDKVCRFADMIPVLKQETDMVNFTRLGILNKSQVVRLV